MAVHSGSAAETLRAVAEAYATNDTDAVLSYFADDARIIGSLRHEDWARKEDWADYLRRELGDFDQLEYRFSEADSEAVESIARTKSVEVVSQRVGLRGTFRGRAFAHDGRWTCALRNDDGEWKVTFSHFSLTLT
jgi:ketosteroid isomerase-like protein